MRTSTVIGIDPGGNGTTGMVVCREWGEKPNRWPRWLPAVVEVAWPVEGGPDKGDPGLAVFELDGLLDRHEEELPQVGVAIEDVAVWQTADDHLLSTCRQVGALDYVAEMRVMRELAVRVLPVTYRSWLLGGRPKGNPDSLVDQALLAAYGGKKSAVGGARCKKCGGKGRRGKAIALNRLPANPPSAGLKSVDRERMSGGVKMTKRSWYEKCDACSGAGHAPRGPLYSLWNPSKQHCRAALAVAVYCYNEVWKEGVVR